MHTFGFVYDILVNFGMDCFESVYSDGVLPFFRPSFLQDGLCLRGVTAMRLYK